MRGPLSVRSLGLVLATSSLLLGCEAVKAIFKAGVWAGVIGVAVLLMLIFGVVRMIKGT